MGLIELYRSRTAEAVCQVSAPHSINMHTLASRISLHESGIILF